ncbi:hypothetical protein NL108_001152 [Boleophthalmus pectinirostris]|nr:hypothetical protein NL108_001152 [Boleophthalmus pectinirostris]
MTPKLIKTNTTPPSAYLSVNTDYLVCENVQKVRVLCICGQGQTGLSFSLNWIKEKFDFSSCSAAVTLRPIRFKQSSRSSAFSDRLHSEPFQIDYVIRRSIWDERAYPNPTVEKIKLENKVRTSQWVSSDYGENWG